MEMGTEMIFLEMEGIGMSLWDLSIEAFLTKTNPICPPVLIEH